MAKKIEGIIDSNGNFHVGQSATRYQSSDGQIFLTKQLADMVDYNNFKTAINKLFASHRKEYDVSNDFVNATICYSDNCFMNEFINKLFNTDLGLKLKDILETINE